jgi:hypothetical protein
MIFACVYVAQHWPLLWVAGMVGMMLMFSIFTQPQRGL